MQCAGDADGIMCDVSRAQGESSGRKWGTEQRVRNGKVSLWGVECTLAVIGAGGPVKRSNVIMKCAGVTVKRRRGRRGVVYAV